ncbi:hypothetical protein SASPL_102122 [Salvia splendens]|uniref:Uncharacterized protein n=1 Tax=Salvia splendens TaxID=180675 RepID=A0A8X8YR97_SALSN|nr:hypothetical protein SASPL_102122 [Salvia splendens]
MYISPCFTSGPLDQSVGRVDVFEEPQLLEHILRPSRECLQEALSLIKPNSLTHLAATYFEHSEHSSSLYLLLYQRIRNTRLLYTPMHNLLDELPLRIPSYPPDSQSFTNTRQRLTQLREELDHHLKKSQSRLHLIRRCSRGSAICLIAAIVGVVMSAVAIATHALVALVACPICHAILLSNMTKKENIHLAQLDVAAKGAYVLRNDLDTIDRLVAPVCVQQLKTTNFLFILG